MRLKCFRSTRFVAASSLLLGFVFSTGLPGTRMEAQTAASTATSSLVTNRLTQPIDDKSVVSLKGTVHPLANAHNDAGAVDDGTRLERIHVSLRRSAAQEAALQQMIKDLHTPGTASYHKWLTPDEFGKQFGPSDADIATLTNWLAAKGFTVTRVNPGKQSLEMSGSAGQFRNTFHAAIHKYKVNGQMHYANASDPQIPSALAPVFGGFVSLNNFQLKSQMHKLGTAEFNPVTHQTKPNWTIGSPSTGYEFPLAPGDFAVQYDLNPLYTAGVKGSGQTIAIVNESNIDPALVAQYRTLFGLPASTINVILDGNDPGIDGVNNPDGPNYASGEAYLDVELSGSVAPAAQIDLVIGADTALESGLILAAEHAVYGNVAPIISLSFGGCESAQGSFNTTINSLWEQAAAQGQTVLVSAGDSGSADCDDDDTAEYATGGQAVNGLGSTPYNVSVGGTDFYYPDYATESSNGYADLLKAWSLTPSNNTPTTSLIAKVPEQPWNDSQFGLDIFPYYDPSAGYTTTTIAAGGGGASNCATVSSAGGCIAGYAKPAWQTGTGVPADGVRDLPDVSLFAANGQNGTFYPICASDGDCQTVAAGQTVQISGVGGTSASTPAFAAILALVESKYGPQGQANFVLYPLAKQYSAAFNDVAVGTNTVPCPYATGTFDSANCIAAANPISIQNPNTGANVTEGQIGSGTTPDYNAVTGYDLASGLGSVDAYQLYNDWGNVKFTSSSVTLTPSSTSFTHGTSVTVSGSVTPSTASGSVSLESTSTEPLQAAQANFPLTSGAYSGSIISLPGGTYTIFGAYSGDGTNASSTSTPVSITVTPEASSTLLYPLNSGTSSSNSTAFASGASIPYGTQVELSGEPVPTTFYTKCVNVSTPPPTCSTISYGSPTGTVTFTDGGNTLNKAQLNVEGDAEYNAGFSIGSHSVVANYSGDSSYNSSASSALTFTVTKDTPDVYLVSGTSPTTSLSASPISAPAGSALIVNVENSANDNNINTYQSYFYTPVAAPTGVVTITGLGSSTITFPALAASIDSSLDVAAGSATVAIPSTVAAGTYTATVSYPGDANYAAYSQAFSLTVTSSGAVATTTTATASPTTTSASSPVNITATVTGTSTNGAPTGSLLFTESGVQLGSTTLPTGTGSSVSTTVSLNSESLLQGVNVITVQYIPATGSVYQSSFGTVTVTNNVGPSGVGSIALTNSGAITIASPGSSGTSTLTVTPSGGFTGSVALSCAVASSSTNIPPTCSVASPVTITSGAATAVLTVSTTAATAELAMPKLRILPLGGGAAMAALLFFLVPAKRRKISTLLGALVLMVGIGMSAGCGGGGSATTGNPGTPAGTYTVTVSATASGISAPSPVTVTVTVQ